MMICFLSYLKKRLSNTFWYKGMRLRNREVVLVVDWLFLYQFLYYFTLCLVCHDMGSRLNKPSMGWRVMGKTKWYVVVK